MLRHVALLWFREIKLIGVYPPIEKMDGPFHLLLNCEKFSLSTNMISNIANLQGFKSLKVGCHCINAQQSCTVHKLDIVILQPSTFIHNSSHQAFLAWISLGTLLVLITVLYTAVVAWR